MTRFFTLLLLLAAAQLSAQSMLWITACTGQTFCLDPGSCTQGNVFLTEQAVTNCNTSSVVSYSYKIDLFNDGSTDIQADLDTVSGAFAKGSHRITWRATDNCGHVTTCSYVFAVKDCNPPNMVCINGLTQQLDAPLCAESFLVSQFVLNYSDNCTPNNQIQFGLREIGTGTGFPPTTSITFEKCQQGLHTLEIWAKDANGLTNQCNSYVLVQNGSGGCACITDADVTMQGCVRTVNNTRLPDYKVRATVESLSGVMPPVTKNVAKNTVDSCFSLVATKLPLDGTYRATLRADRFGNPLNGVTTFDLVVISRHILGLEPLTSVYRGIAADVNNSHTITTFDIVETRKLILGIYDSFPGVPSWRLIRPFVNPSDFSGLTAVKDTYQLMVPSLAANVTLPSVSFIAIKTGDVNLSALAFGSESESRNAPLPLQIDDQYLAAGEERSIPIRLDESVGLDGWQLVLRTDPGALQITAVEGLDDENYLRAADGSLRALWFGEHSRDFAAGEAIFTLKITALRPLWLSQALVLENEKMACEAYQDATGRRALTLRVLAKTPAGASFLAPQPNPFAAETIFRCRLEQPGELRLEIFDATGRLVQTQTISAETGLNTLSLPAASLPGAGMYAFRIRAGGQVYAGHLVRM
ncbi:MAG: T9SS type A sorting domain-containing protein [Saprospiraceae bacterium]